jgi:hypothetical protein
MEPPGLPEYPHNHRGAAQGNTSRIFQKDVSKVKAARLGRKNCLFHVNFLRRLVPVLSIPKLGRSFLDSNEEFARSYKPLLHSYDLSALE